MYLNKNNFGTFAKARSENMASNLRFLQADPKNPNIFSITGTTVKPVDSEEPHHEELKDQIVQIPYRYLQYGSFMHLMPYDVQWSNGGFTLTPTKGARRVCYIALHSHVMNQM